MEDADKKILLSYLAPFFVGVIILSVFLTLLTFKYVPAFKTLSSPKVVVFDVTKYVNAQRSIASSYLTNDVAKMAQTNELLMGLSDRTKVAIEKFAGPGTLVMVKQGVVAGEMEDITDKVLTEVGLSVKVPTEDAVRAVLNPTPTQSLVRDGPQINEMVKRREQKEAAALLEESSKSNNSPKYP